MWSRSYPSLSPLITRHREWSGSGNSLRRAVGAICTEVSSPASRLEVLPALAIFCNFYD
jgi:hypothetical protein